VDEEHYLSTIQEERAKQLDDMMKNVPFPGENISFNFRVGDPTDELMRVVVEEDIDLVVMGMKSKTELEYVFAGSVAERFFRRCPVTVIFYRDADSSDKLRQRLIKHKR
jgi:nucleotide-binding universal stress UspA family protein